MGGIIAPARTESELASAKVAGKGQCLSCGGLRHGRPALVQARSRGYRAACRQRHDCGWPAYVTQNGWNINLLNEAGQPSRAWFRWRGRIWAENWNEGAVYSPDGMILQFDRGTIWQRYLGEPVLRRRQ